MDIDPQEVFNNTTGIFVLIFGVIGLVIGVITSFQPNT